MKTILSKVLSARLQETEIIQIIRSLSVPKFPKTGVGLREILKLPKGHILYFLKLFYS